MAAIPFGVDINLNNNQLLKSRLENLAADPANNVSLAGRVYFNTTTNRARWYNGTLWQNLAGGAPSRRFQFFTAGDALSLTVTTAVATLPADNNQINLYVQGNRLFPDQGAEVLGWTRDGNGAPAVFNLHSREGEWVMIEWYEA